MRDGAIGDSNKELLADAVQHAVAIHQHQDTPQWRAQLKQLFKEGTPPLVVQRKETA